MGCICKFWKKRLTVCNSFYSVSQVYILLFLSLHHPTKAHNIRTFAWIVSHILLKRQVFFTLNITFCVSAQHLTQVKILSRDHLRSFRNASVRAYDDTTKFRPSNAEFIQILGTKFLNYHRMTMRRWLQGVDWKNDLFWF